MFIRAIAFMADTKPGAACIIVYDFPESREQPVLVPNVVATETYEWDEGKCHEGFDIAAVLGTLEEIVAGLAALALAGQPAPLGDAEVAQGATLVS